MAVPLLDLRAQHATIRDETVAAVLRIVDAQTFILGEPVVELERAVAALSHTRHAIGCANGTDAILLAMRALDIGRGDEVITTPFTFFATAGTIHNVGATPVFVDIEPSTFNIVPAAVAAARTSRTKAVIPVDLFGQMAAVEQVASAMKGVPVIEDAAQSIGARRMVDGEARMAGEIPTIGTFSFFPSKNLGGFGDGGAVTTNDAVLAAQVRALRNHGTEQKLRHERIGGNFRLDELQAALLRVKLPHLSRWTAERRRLAVLYRERLAGLPIGLPPPDPGSVWNQFVIRVPAARRGPLLRHLEARGIASAVYYPIPLHLQPALAFLGHRPGDFPNAERAAEESLALPIFPGLTDGDLFRVAGALRDFFLR
jgi:dTDP-4-amino-4,6-dideoxygalactose transaminase